MSQDKNITIPEPTEDEFLALAELFKIFADCTRVHILYEISKREMCVMEISQALNMSQSSISHQLRILKQSRLVKYRRDGRTIYYSLADGHVSLILGQGLEHVGE